MGEDAKKPSDGASSETNTPFDAVAFLEEHMAAGTSSPFPPPDDVGQTLSEGAKVRAAGERKAVPSPAVIEVQATKVFEAEASPKPPTEPKKSESTPKETQVEWTPPVRPRTPTSSKTIEKEAEPAVPLERPKPVVPKPVFPKPVSRPTNESTTHTKGPGARNDDQLSGSVSVGSASQVAGHDAPTKKEETLPTPCGLTESTAPMYLQRFDPAINWLPEELRKSNKVPESELEMAVQFHREYAGNSCFSATLVKLEMISSNDVLTLLQAKYKLQRADLTKVRVTLQIFSICPLVVCKRLGMLAYISDDGAKPTITVVISSPSEEALNETRQIQTRRHGCKLNLEIANEASIKAVLAELEVEIHQKHDRSRDAVTDEIKEIFTEAIDNQSSDIHFEPLPEVVVVRIRVDGKLRMIRIYPLARKEEILRSAQIFTGLDVGKPHIPQDVEKELNLRAKTYKVRVSSIPTTTGHSIVCRLLDKEAGQVEFVQLGVEPDNVALLVSILSKPYGAIINVGPTGSGKSTSMLAMLSKVDGNTEKILTIENPPEYRIGKAQQVKYHESNISFAAALKSFMRQDPDHIMVGEIRDIETAEAAISAALTGHKVFSTVHGNHGLTGLQRFIDWGIDPSSLAQGVSVLIAQRLLPRLCMHCRRPHPDSTRLIDRYKIKLAPEQTHIWEENRRGCPHCTNGFRGRVGAFEFIPISGDDDIADIVARGEKTLVPQCEAKAKEKGYRFLREDAFLKVGRGLTTVNEVLANVDVKLGNA